MVLTDREIWQAVDSGQIVIDPKPPQDAVSSTALDLTLGSDLRVWKVASGDGVERVVCPADPAYKFTNFVKDATSSVKMNAEGFTLEPKQFMLAWTAERVELPYQSRLAARVEGKSSLARLGVGVHVTAPTIHAGFAGLIQLEIFNHGNWKIKLVPGMRICQLIFEQTTGTPNAGYKGQFSNQTAT